MIVAHALSKRFGSRWAVRDMSFHLSPGYPVGLLGPNGAGKSTLIRMLTGLLIPDQGSVRICGADPARAGCAARGSIGYLPESAPLYAEMTCADYLRHMARIAGVPSRNRPAYIDDTINRCALADVRRRRIGSLSKGYRQRVGLAGAIVHRPQVIILDEPTNALDPAQVADARQLLRDLAHDRTLLVSTHLLAEAERTCDRLLVVAAGRLLADDTPASLIHRALPRRAVRIQVQRSRADEAAHALHALCGFTVTTATSHDDHAVLDAQPPAGFSPDPRDPVAAALARLGITPRELTLAPVSLEDAFAALIRSTSTTEALK